MQDWERGLGTGKPISYNPLGLWRIRKYDLLAGL